MPENLLPRIEMHIAGHPYPVMKPAEVDLIYHSSLRILEEMGMEIQNPDLLRKFAKADLPVDYGAERVRFPVRFVESFIAESQKHDWEQAHPTVSASAGVYHGLYHDPRNGRLVPWDEENLVFYFSLARQLPQVTVASMLGCRLPVPGPFLPAPIQPSRIRICDR